MSRSFLEKFSAEGGSESVLDYLNRSDFDELVEIDLIHDHCVNLYHVDGKYFVPLPEGNGTKIFRYSLEHMFHPDDRERVRETMDPDTLLERLATSDPPGVFTVQFRYRLLDGGWRWVEQVVVGGTQFGFGEGIVRIFIFDIQNQKDRQMGRTPAYASRGTRDELTGLYGQKQFYSKAEKLVRDRDDVDWMLIAIDIENFRLFNEWYGHESGDLLLAQMGEQFRQAEKDYNGLAGYMGQDDFCLLLPYDEESIATLFDEVQTLIASRGASMGFLPAFGVSKLGKKGSVVVASDRAAIAASQVKGDFRTRIRMYDPSMQNKTEWEYCLLSEFQRGLKNHELYFCLQPQCTASSGRVVGAESLARWKTPDGETVPPDTFVPILEKYGFVTDLDQYIWESVCAWLHRWIKDGHTPIPISINVSQVDFFTIDVPEHIMHLVEKYELPKTALKIEVTESAYGNDADLIKEAVQKLRDEGFLVFMDDFGSGYSSLNMLRNVNVDAIKLDAQFLHLSDEDEKKGIHILETVVNMAQAMAVPIIVEGVESAEQVQFLERLGCQYIQGFYYYRPMQVADFERLIDDQDNIDTGGFSFNANQPFRVREFMDSNIYTDTMLNNILGAAAFYCWDGKENVDIVRYNEKFMELTNVPDFNERLVGIQQYFHPDDVQKLFTLLALAENDHLNGASGVMRVYRTDGTMGRFFVHFFFLEEAESGKIFYGAMQEVTEITSLQSQMKLLSDYSSESIVFMSRRGGRWRYQVAAHGLCDVLGLSVEEFERELNSGRFFRRLDEGAVEWLAELAQGEPPKESLGRRLVVENAKDGPAELFVKIDYVHDENSDVDYILALRLREDA